MIGGHPLVICVLIGAENMYPPELETEKIIQSKKDKGNSHIKNCVHFAFREQGKYDGKQRIYISV